MFTETFWKATLERVVSTASQSAILAVAADQFDALQTDWRMVVGFALGGGALSLLKCLAAATVGKRGPSLTGAERLAPEVAA